MVSSVDATPGRRDRGDQARLSRRRPSPLRTPWWLPSFFVGPTVLLLVVFLLVPLVAALAIAFTNWNGNRAMNAIEFVGLDNFIEVITDEAFWASVGRTVFYAGVSVPFTVGFGLILAIALNRPLAGRGALRAIFFMPAIVNVIAIGSVWLLLLDPTNGPINNALRALGWSEPPGWLTSTDAALPALVLMTIWAGTGYVAVIYLAGLQAMPHELYEAARIDGAGPLRQFATITWPALMPLTAFLVITEIISRSQGFGLIAFMTSGGPGTSTTVMSYFMYQHGILYFHFGYAAAMGIYSMVAVLALVIAVWKIRGRSDLYGEDQS